ncbi:MAG: pilus assembly protein [Planctomycetaceae bacterium]|nr:pilus assembly protein [Planctomycetaceae bacterium]MCB9951165.1 pilus assembly protein [Planctomycetaceae bacterium]
MKTQNQNLKTRHRRRGSLTMELVLVLPILMLILMGMFEFSFLFLAQGKVEDAAHAGARLATLHGVYEGDVIAAVHRSLTPRLRSNAKVYTRMGEHSGDEIVVTVEIPSSDASPDLLWAIGYSLKGKTIVAETHMTKE